MIEKPVTRQRIPTERPAGDEDIVGTLIHAIGIDAVGQAGSHGSPDARAAENVGLNTGLLKGLVNAEVSAAKRSAPASDETYRLTRQEAQQPRAVFGILQRDVMVHEDVAARQPGAGARYDVAACLVY